MAKTNVNSVDHKKIIEEVKHLRDQWKKELSSADDISPSLAANPSNHLLNSKSQPKHTSTSTATDEYSKYLNQLPELRDSNRNLCLKKLASEFICSETLTKLKESDPSSKYLNISDMIELVVSLESAMWDKQQSSYLKFARERCLMIKTKTNQELKFAILDGTLSPDEFATKDSRELESEETRKKYEEGHKWKLQAYII